MNQGPNPPAGNAGGKGRRRRRGRRGAAPHQANQQHGKQHGQGQGQGGQQHGHGHSQGHGQGQGKHGGGGRRFGKKRGGGGHKGGGQRQSQHDPLGGVYSAPMDHSYRAVLGEHDGNVQADRGRGRQFGGEPEVPAIPHDAPTRIYAFVDDLFFLAKINETARKLGVKVEFVKTDKEVFEKMSDNGNGKPSLIIFDLNNLNAKPLTVIPKLKSKLKKETNIIGFVSHVQGELKMKAQEAGCDMVLPRSAFSQNLAQLLRRHTAQDEEVHDHGQPN
jgi:hypothetical protein